MLSDVLAEYLAAPVDEVERLMTLPNGSVYDDPAYCTMLGEIDVRLLERTLTHAYAAYQVGLPQFTTMLRREYGVDAPLTSYTLGEWMIAFLKSPERLSEMTKLNMLVPRYVLWDTLPMLINILETMPNKTERQEWQKALTVLLLPLTATH